MKKPQFIIICILLSIWQNTIHADNGDYGLYIKAFPFSEPERTSLVLENGRALKLNKETTMSFDINVRKENVFSCVFRMITNPGKNIDLLFTVSEDDKRYPMLVIGESTYMIPQEIVCDKWVPVSITLSSAENKITLNYDGSKISVPDKISEADNVKVAFGVCPFEDYILYDLASVNIRNIKIFDGDNLIRFWKLKDHEGAKTLDSIAQVPAIVTNPLWITELYSSWEKVYSRAVKDNSMFAYNPDENLIYIVSPDSKEIMVFDPEHRKEEIIQVKDGLIAANAPNQLFYDRQNRQLVSYNLDENLISRFSFANNSWSNHIKPTLEHGYWNNSVACSPDNSTLVSFGGYGFYKYNNDLLRFDMRNNSVKKANIPEILPRYSTATAIVGDVLYIFGGRGNKSGRQELSPHNLYDFYTINLLAEQTNRLWELTDVDEDFLPSENMIFDEKDNCFYVFTTREGGTLLKLRKDKNLLDWVSFPIHEDLTAHYLYTNLYYSPAQKKFYALINKTWPGRSAELSIYSLSYPPLTVNEVAVDKQDEQQTDTANDFSKRIVIIGCIIGLVIIATLYYLLKKRQTISKKEQPAFIKRTGDEESATAKMEKAEYSSKETEQTFYDFSKQSICFLGGFNVMDKEGQNITAHFTPTLKYLLVLLILSTEKDPKGISGKKLIQLLWYDKNEVSAKNNRNVYLSKLRSILENVGNAELVNQNSFWSIKLNDIASDYKEVMRLFALIEENNMPEQADIDHLVELLLQGVLLPNTETDWVDTFKSDFSNLTIDILIALSKNTHIKLSDDLKLKIADIIFLYDFINEEALYLKCSIFFNLGKKGIAKTTYDNFTKEYYNLLGAKYKYSLTDVIERKNIEH